MNLKYVTITGIDNNINITTMVEISKEFPFVEWGFLYTIKPAGTARSNSFAPKFFKKLNDECCKQNIATLNLSLHLCGRICRDFIEGKLDLKDFYGGNSWIKLFSRVQFNVNIAARCPDYKCEVFENQIFKNPIPTPIIQYHNGNKQLISDLKNFRSAYNILYDFSGGRGLDRPDKWDKPFKDIFTGYAGGINPDNICEKLEIVTDLVGNGVCWIDMETGVRDSDDKLDWFKVYKVLEKCKKYALV